MSTNDEPRDAYLSEKYFRQFRFDDGRPGPDPTVYEAIQLWHEIGNAREMIADLESED